MPGGRDREEDERAARRGLGTRRVSDNRRPQASKHRKLESMVVCEANLLLGTLFELSR
jgi:hypothetical protein